MSNQPDWEPDPSLASYVYEQGEGRFKHKWNRDEAGFVPSTRGPVGKCHNSLSEQEAQRLLHSGIVAPDPYTDDEPEGAPEQVFAVDRGCRTSLFRRVLASASMATLGGVLFLPGWRRRSDSGQSQKARRRSSSDG